MTRWPATALAVWSVVVWAGRLRNIADDTGLTVANSLLPLSFVVGGVVVLVGAVVRAGWLPAAVRVLATWTVAVWAVRGTAILLADHDTGFKLVHTVLAALSIGLAAVALRWAGASGRGPRRVPASGTGTHRRP